MKTQILDSSDEESENEVLQDSDIIARLENQLFVSENSADFAINLALIVHYMSDRIFRNSPIDKYYKKHKLEVTGLVDKDFTKIVESIASVIKQVLEIKELSTQDSIKCFNFIFNKSVKLSHAISQAIEAKKQKILDFDFTQVLLTELKTLQLDLGNLSENPLILEIAKENNSSEELLSFAKIISRNNKNTIKNYKIKDIDSNTINASYKLPDSVLGTFSEHHVVKNNGNAVAHVPNLGKYADIFKDQFFKDNKVNIIDNIFNIIKNNQPSVISNNTSYIDEKLVHFIFITEMGRNNATLFTAPIFLEFLQKDQQANFPMSKEKAVSDSRGISKHYANFLPKHHIMDYDEVNVSNKVETQKFLKEEGTLLMIWLKSISENFRLFFEKLDIYPSLITISSKSLNQISVDDIFKASDFLKTTKYKLQLSSEMIDQIKHITQNSLQGIRPEILINKSQNVIGNNLEKALQQNQSNKIACTVLEELKKFISILYTEFEKEKDKIGQYIDSINIKNEIQSILPNLPTILSENLKKWYNIDYDLTQLFKLKAAGEKIDTSDSSDQEVMQGIEEQKNSGKQLNKRTLEDIQSQDEKQDSSSQKISRLGSTPRETSKEPVDQKTIKEGQPNTTNLQGAGDYGEEKAISYISPFFGKYTLDALNYILILRINDLQLKNIKVLPGVFIDQKINNIPDIFTQALNSTEKIILVPLNLFNKHAVGLIFEKSKNNVIQVKYVDPLNQHIPQELKQLMSNISEDKVIFQEITVEQQKYANCGPEVIENFISCLIDHRLSQEKAIELHSRLIENALVNTNFNLYLEFIESDNKLHDIYYDNFQIDTMGEDHALV